MKCTKVSFNTKGQARATLRTLKERGRSEYRVYHCPECQTYHLTSDRGGSVRKRAKFKKEIPSKQAEWIAIIMQLRSIKW